MKKAERQKADKEQVLFNILEATTRNTLLSNLDLFHGYPLDFLGGNPLPAFVSLYLADTMGDPLKMGDIVKRQTVRGDYRFGISEVIEIITKYELIVHELCHPQNTCHISNEGFTVLRFIDQNLLLCGHKYKIYRWIEKAFYKIRNPFNGRYITDIQFASDQVFITCKPGVLDQKKKDENGDYLYAQPLITRFPYHKDTRYREIYNHIEESKIASYEPFEYKYLEQTLRNTL